MVTDGCPTDQGCLASADWVKLRQFREVVCGQLMGNEFFCCKVASPKCLLKGADWFFTEPS